MLQVILINVHLYGHVLLNLSFKGFLKSTTVKKISQKCSFFFNTNLKVKQIYPIVLPVVQKGKF